MAEGTERLALVHPPVARGEASAIYVARMTDVTWIVGGPEFTSEAFKHFAQCTPASAAELAPDLPDLESLRVGDCLSRAAVDATWRPGRMPAGDPYLVSLLVQPDAQHPERAVVGQTIVNTWVVTGSVESATRLAAEDVRVEGWELVERSEAGAVSEFDLDDASVCYYQQALIDGFVAVFNQSKPSMKRKAKALVSSFTKSSRNRSCASHVHLCDWPRTGIESPPASTCQITRIVEVRSGASAPTGATGGVAELRRGWARGRKPLLGEPRRFPHRLVIGYRGLVVEV